MPANRKINCPACGFSIDADSISCDFCGYEFETHIDDKPSSSAFKSDLSVKETVKEAESPARQTQKKNGNGKKNGGKGKPAVIPPNTEKGNVPSTAAVQEARPGQRDGNAPSRVNPQDRIRELEKQLSEAEKELDVISRILVDTPGEKTQMPVPAVAAASQAVARAERKTGAEMPRQVAADSHSDREISAANAFPSSAVSGRGSLQFKVKAPTLISIATGAAVYVVSAILSSTMGSLEEYFLMLSGALLITLGLYASLESKIIDRPAARNG